MPLPRHDEERVARSLMDETNVAASQTGTKWHEMLHGNGVLEPVHQRRSAAYDWEKQVNVYIHVQKDAEWG